MGIECRYQKYPKKKNRLLSAARDIQICKLLMSNKHLINRSKNKHKLINHL